MRIRALALILLSAPTLPLVGLLGAAAVGLRLCMSAGRRSRKGGSGDYPVVQELLAGLDLLIQAGDYFKIYLKSQKIPRCGVEQRIMSAA